jgi:nitrate reductase NapE component
MESGEVSSQSMRDRKGEQTTYITAAFALFHMFAVIFQGLSR